MRIRFRYDEDTVVTYTAYREEETLNIIFLLGCDCEQARRAVQNCTRQVLIQRKCVYITPFSKVKSYISNKHSPDAIVRSVVPVSTNPAELARRVVTFVLSAPYATL